MKYRIASFLFLFCIPVSLWAKSPLDSLLVVLDETIAHSARYEQQKKDRIHLIKEELKRPRISDADIYRIHNRLFEEYEAYICDSARHYINLNIAMATRLNNREWLNELFIRKANILATTGLYDEAIRLLRRVDKRYLPGERLSDYYAALSNVYLYRAEYVSDDEYIYEYLDSMYVYRDSTLLHLSEGTYSYTITKAPILIDQQKTEEAEILLRTCLLKQTSGTRDYAVLASIMAFMYQCTGDSTLQKSYLVESAISDIQAVVKENKSLRTLSELLYGEGQITRANRYMKVSIEDANFFNARLRNIQASKMLPIIDNAYQQEREAQRETMRKLLIIISMLSLFLMVAIVYVILQMRKLARARRSVINVNHELKRLNEDLTHANRQQKLMNNSLAETNRIKEEYIGRFLGLCSTYIDKLETYRRMLNKKAASGKVDELYKTLKSNQFIEDELKEFYLNFDNAFLSIFPDFLERFNALLPKEEKITPKQGELLTTELRIFALIRLGINDSPKIAGFLRYSITTIYTYRSKLRNKSCYKETFEEEVMKIGSF